MSFVRVLIVVFDVWDNCNEVSRGEVCCVLMNKAELQIDTEMVAAVNRCNFLSRSKAKNLLLLVILSIA